MRLAPPDATLTPPAQTVAAPRPSPWAALRASLRASPRRWAVLGVGLVLYAVALALLVQGGRGLGPWDVLHTGLSRLVGIGVGRANVAVGVVLVLALWRTGRFGAGTLANAVVIGLLLDALLPFVPFARTPTVGWAMHAAGTLGVGLATGLYLAAAMGAGPRDTLMLELMHRTGRSARTVRTALELAVLALGIALGGTFGWGTLAFALGIGPATQFGLKLFGVRK